MDEIKFSTFSLATGTAEIEQGVGVKGGQNFKRSNNLTATTDPTASDDTSLYYTKGSIWINQPLGRFWSCSDPAAGAAVWKCLTQDSGFQTITISEGSETQLSTTTGFVKAVGTGSVDEATIKLPASPYLGKTVTITVVYPVGTALTITNSAGVSKFQSDPITTTLTITMVCTNASTNDWNWTGFATN